MIINKIEDFRDYLSDDLYKTLEELTTTNKCESGDQIKVLEEDIKSYDASVYGLRSSMVEAIEQLEKILSGDKIKRADIEGVKKILENSEGY